MWLIKLIVLNQAFAYKPGEFVYPRKMLFRLILMSILDERLSSRDIKRKTQMDVGYMYLAGMQKPSYRIILRFKLD